MRLPAILGVCLVGCATSPSGQGGPDDTNGGETGAPDTGSDTGTDTGTDTDTGSDTDSGTSGVVETGPALNVLSPASTNRIEASGAVQAFAGTADETVVSVTWATSGGATGTATGTTAWSADVALDEGLQWVTFTATDGDGATTNLPIVVAWQPDIAFTAAPSLSANLVLPGGSVDASVEFTTSAAVSGVDLVLACYANGAESEARVAMTEAAGAWSASVSAPGSVDDCVVFAAVATDSGERQSPTRFLRVREPMTAARAEELSTMLVGVGDAMAAGADWADSVAIAEGVLAARTDISVVAADEYGIFWITTDGGLFGAEPPGGAGTLSGSDPQLPWSLQTLRPGVVITDLPRDPLLEWSSEVSCLAAEDIEPFGYDDDGSSDVIAAIAQLQPGLIRVTAHGGTLPGGLVSGRASKTGRVTYLPDWYTTSGAGGAFTMDLAVGIPAANLPSYLESGSWVDLGAVVTVDPAAGNTLTVRSTPQLFDDQLADGSLAGSVFVATSCESAKNTTLSTVLFKKGVSAYVGYSDVVDSGYAAAVEAALFGAWLPKFDASADASVLGGLEAAVTVALAAVSTLDDDAWVIANGDTPETADTPAYPTLRWNDVTDMRATCCLGLDGEVSESATVASDSALSRFGWSAAGVGDVNGDGFMDVVGGAPAVGSGTAWVLSGDLIGDAVRDGSTTTIGDLMLGSTTGVTAGDFAGQRVAGIGDLTGDGLADVIVGAPYDDTFGTSSGAVLVAAWDGAGMVTEARIEGQHEGEMIGSVLGGAPLAWRNRTSNIGDLSGDGEADLVVGSSTARLDSAGSIYIFFGPVYGTLATDDADADILGTRTRAAAASDAAIVGDLNGDGISELAVRGDVSTTANAAVEIFAGPITVRSYLASSTYSWVSLTGSSTSETLRTAGAGDTNADGYDDVIVGSYGYDKAYVVLGSGALSDRTLSGAADATYSGAAGSAAGWSLTGAGDVNCDGVDDVAFGAMTDTSNAGSFCLALGPLAGSVRCDAMGAGLPATTLGSAIAGTGDLDGQGCEDLAVGAYLSSTAATNAGDLLVYLAE